MNQPRLVRGNRTGLSRVDCSGSSDDGAASDFYRC